MATFFNQASLNFKGTQTNSNPVTGEYGCGIGASAKMVISEGYAQNSGITYIISLTNEGGAPLNDIVITDNLGEYAFNDASLFPLEYVEGSLKYFVNGVLTDGPTALAGPPLVISGIDLPQGANALIVYEARTTAYAPLALGSEITNTATVSTETSFEPLVITATVPALPTSIPVIAKTLYPDNIVDCGENVNYTFTILNIGNTEIVATDDLILSDTFEPPIRNISVTYNGEEWSEGVNYNYNEVSGVFTTLPGQITVPAATYTQDPISGVYTMTPGVTIITVSGII